MFHTAIVLSPQAKRLSLSHHVCTPHALPCTAKQSKTLMFVNLAPTLYNSSESFCSMDFAARVRTVELGKATKNVTSSSSSGKSRSRKK